jgi:hypothetical protein
LGAEQRHNPKNEASENEQYASASEDHQAYSIALDRLTAEYVDAYADKGSENTK